MKLRSKMLYLYIGINIIIFLAVGIYLMTSYKASKFEGIKDEYMSQLKHLEFSLSSFFESTENELRTLESIDLVRNEEDFEFTSYLNADPETFVLNPGPEEAEIVKILNAFRTENEYVNSVYMGRANGAFVRSHPRGKNTKYDPRERPWYQLALEDPKRIMITDPYKSVTTEDLNIGFVKALVNEPGNVYGVVGMDVTLSNLTEYFRNVDVSRSGWITLWDSKGTMLVTNNPEHMMKNYLEVSDNESVYNGIMNSKSGYTKPHETMNSTYGFYYTEFIVSWGLV